MEKFKKNAKPSKNANNSEKNKTKQIKKKKLNFFIIISFNFPNKTFNKLHMSKLIILFLFLAFQGILSQYPTRFDSSSRRERSDIVADLDKFREQQRKFFDENAKFNSSGFFRSGAGNDNSTQVDLEERLKKLKNTIPQTLGIKCYENQEACQNDGGCASVSDCIPCMNWDTRKPGYRCLKDARKEKESTDGNAIP